MLNVFINFFNQIWNSYQRKSVWSHWRSTVQQHHGVIYAHAQKRTISGPTAAVDWLLRTKIMVVISCSVGKRIFSRCYFSFLYCKNTPGMHENEVLNFYFFDRKLSWERFLSILKMSQLKLSKLFRWAHSGKNINIKYYWCKWIRPADEKIPSWPNFQPKT